jgi:cysteine desulfuration protein SufE
MTKQLTDMTINDIQDEIIEEFSSLDDWMDKYQLLIDLGNEQEPLAEQYKTESNLIDGCQSRVWLQADYTDGRLFFTAESDALIVKGIVALLIRVLSGHTPQEILDADLYFIEQIGLKEHLSPTRSNGLLAMVKQIKAYALAYQAKLNHLETTSFNHSCFACFKHQLFMVQPERMWCTYCAAMWSNWCWYVAHFVQRLCTLCADALHTLCKGLAQFVQHFCTIPAIICFQKRSLRHIPQRLSK